MTMAVIGISLNPPKSDTPPEMQVPQALLAFRCSPQAVASSTSSADRSRPKHQMLKDDTCSRFVRALVTAFSQFAGVGQRILAGAKEQEQVNPAGLCAGIRSKKCRGASGERRP